MRSRQPIVSERNPAGSPDRWPLRQPGMMPTRRMRRSGVLGGLEKLGCLRTGEGAHLGMPNTELDEACDVSAERLLVDRVLQRCSQDPQSFKRIGLFKNPVTG